MADYSRRPVHVCIALPLVVLVTATIVISISWAIHAQDAPHQDGDEKLFNMSEDTERQAIRELHSRLDDDKNGSVDKEESEEFVREELHNRPGSRALHKEDQQISFEELWTSWKNSQVRNWTSREVADWLVTAVELQELVDQVMRFNIIGRMLPIIATNNGQILYKLELQGAVKRNKLQLRALDIILFGLPPTPRSYWKDAIAVLSVTMCVVGLVLAWRKSKRDSATIDQFLESIREYETEVIALKKRLEQSSTDECDEGSALDVGEENEEEREDASELNSVQSTESIELEMEALKTKVSALQAQLMALMTDRKRLQDLLHQSHKQEFGHLESSKKLAEEEVLQAQKACDKIRKRRVTVIGAFQLANSSSLEEAGLQITKAVNKMHKITESFGEFHNRWRQIEHTCGFSITMNKGGHMVSSYNSYSVSVDSDVQSVTSYSTNHSITSSVYSQRQHNKDHYKLKHQQNSLPCLQQSSSDDRSYPRQMSAPVKTSVRTREMHSASSAPLLDVVQDSSDDVKAGSASPSERQKQWWVGSRGSNDLLAIAEEEGNTRVRSFKRSQESLERQTDSSSDSVDGKDSPKIKTGSVKRTLKSKIRSTLKGGKSTLL